MDDTYPLLGIVLILMLLIVKAIISNAKSAISNVNEAAVSIRSTDGKLRGLVQWKDA